MSARDKLKQKQAENVQKEDESQEKQKSSVRSKTRASAAKRQKEKKEHFLRTKMWINYIASSIQKDRGTIPANIGNRIMITNNMFVTKYYLSSVIQVEALSLKTPVSLVSELTRALRTRKCGAAIDVVFKNQPYEVDLNESGLESRIRMWERALELEDISPREKEVAARCIYTKNQVASGLHTMRTRIFIKLHAKTGSELLRAEHIIYEYLRSINAQFNQVTGDLTNVLKYITILSDYHDASLKDMKSIINSNTTLAQMLPNSGAYEGKGKCYLGVNMFNGSEYRISWDEISGARNVYVVARAGEGKTAIAMNAAQSAVESGMAVCIQDIKGNEFVSFIKGTGGYIVSLRQDSSGFVNSWKMIKEDTTDKDAEMYFRQRVAFSKEQMIILSGVESQAERIDLEELLDEFHERLYLMESVVPSNRNTWVNTLHLTPYDVYDKFVEFITPEVQMRYPVVSKKVLSTLRMTMSRGGSKSYIFLHEFDYMSILRAPTLMFDFGMIAGAAENVDPILFKLKFAYMRKLNAEYTAYKYARGIKVFKILEESQIAVSDPEIMHGYVEEFTLRRAQGQTAWLLGNSVQALLDNDISKPLIENTTGILVGAVVPQARDLIISKFGLEEYSDLFDVAFSKPEYSKSFLFFNQMEPNASIPLLKVIMPDDETRKYKVLKPVAQNTSHVNG